MQSGGEFGGGGGGGHAGADPGTAVEPRKGQRLPLTRALIRARPAARCKHAAAACRLLRPLPRCAALRCPAPPRNAAQGRRRRAAPRRRRPAHRRRAPPPPPARAAQRRGDAQAQPPFNSIIPRQGDDRFTRTHTHTRAHPPTPPIASPLKNGPPKKRGGGGRE